MEHQVRELQEKAMNGDQEALQLYEEYVNRGLAPRINVKQQFKSSLETQSMMTAGYEEAAKQRGDDLFTSKSRELTNEEVLKANPATKIAYGYGQRAEAVAEHKAKRKAYRESNSQGVQSQTFGEMVQTSFSEISNGYGQQGGGR
ncbi:hypothetical protein AS52_00247 [Priestia megaterium Q3]|uniref:Uncharacterized protein n=1 Tax=Priestia megaterium Q3 TaxID=1452722 RepID=A0A806TDC3_PRIMG|nr:hypothetical protein [Priestia megaterium]AKP75268.1 hypothetical protein AS52_00247 [Priestia megaterium Q3]